MIDVRYYRNVADLMGYNLPKPQPRTACMLDDDRAETLNELKIIHVEAMEVEYHDDDN